MSENTKTMTDAELRTQAYNAATRVLRDRHREEFTEIVKDEADQRGVTYTPRATPAERAEKQIADLLAKHPELADKFDHTPAKG